MELRAATGQRHTTTGSTQIFMRTRDGVKTSGAFQIAPKTTGLQGSIMSVGLLADRGNIIAFRSSGGTIINERTGAERSGGFVQAEDRHISKGSDCDRRNQDVGKSTSDSPRDVRKHKLRHLEPCLCCQAEIVVEQLELTLLPSRELLAVVAAYVPRTERAPNHESSLGGVSKFSTDHMFMGEDGTPAAIFSW